MRGTVGEFLIARLKSQGINHCFGVPGDYNLSFFDQVYKSDIHLVNTTTAMNAGYAADAYSRIHGIGCACVTYCVGGFSIINAVAGAYAERSPIVVISGSPGIKERREDLLLHHMVGHFECQHHLFEHVTCANTVLRDPDHAGYEIDRMLLAVQEFKQPVYIELPRDIVNKPIRYDVYSQLTPKEEKTDEQTLNEVIGEVVDYINSARKPVIWAGVEMARFGFSKRLVKFAESANIPVASTLLGKSVFNEMHPLSLGVYCESIASDELKSYMDDCDCLIVLGVMMTDVNMGFLPQKTHKRKIISASTNSLQIRNHEFQHVRFADFIEMLFKSKITRRAEQFLPKKVIESFVPQNNKKIESKRFFQKINSIVANNNLAIVTDVGDSLFGAVDLVVKDHHFISNAFYTSMGFAIPATVGIHFANKDLRTVVIVGDGAFQMSCTEISTLLNNNSNCIIFVINNGGYCTERLIKDGAFNDVRNWQYHKIVEMLNGGISWVVNTEDELEKAVEIALLQKEKLSIIEVVVDRKDHSPLLERMISKLSERI